MRSILLLTVLVGASAWVVVRHLPQDAHAEAGRARPVEKTQEIQSIAIDGRGLPLAALRATLTSKVGDSIDPRRLERDRAALAAELESRGYL
ncbi:MAG: POTRA domain-containing protein, partial [Kofleriaceae bacterium]